MARERAGLARSLVIFFIGLGAAGLLLAVINGPVDTIFAVGTGLSSSPQAAEGAVYVDQFWNALPFTILFLAFVQLLGAAAAERRLPGQ